MQDPSNTIIWHDMSFPSLFFVVQYAGLLKPPIGHREDRVRATPSALLRPTSKTVPLRRLHALTNTVVFFANRPSFVVRAMPNTTTASYVQEWSRALFQFTVQCNAHASFPPFFLFLSPFLRRHCTPCVDKAQRDLLHFCPGDLEKKKDSPSANLLGFPLYDSSSGRG